MRRHERCLVGLLLALATTFAAFHPVLIVHALRERKALLPTEDSEVRSVSPDFNFGRAPEFWVIGNYEEVLSFLMFDLSQIPSGAAIEEATLRLYEPTEGVISLCTVNVHHCPSNDWTENGITYNNKPAYQPESMGTVNVTYHVAKWYNWDITSTAASTFTATDKRLSLALDGTTYLQVIAFNSRQSPAADRRPELSVLYSYTPSSGIDLLLVRFIVVAVVAALVIGLLAYTRRKKGKQL